MGTETWGHSTSTWIRSKLIFNPESHSSLLRMLEINQSGYGCTVREQLLETHLSICLWKAHTFSIATHPLDPMSLTSQQHTESGIKWQLKAFLRAPTEPLADSKELCGQDEWAACLHPHLLMLRGGGEMLKKGKAEREQSQPTPSVGTHHHPWLQSLSSHTASWAWCFLTDLTHYASTPFWNPLSKQKQALLEKCINPVKSPDDNIIHFLMLFSDPSLGGPSLPASLYSSLI